MLKKSRMSALTILPLLLGWAGGILRYLQLSRGFDEKGLSTGSVWGYLLAALTAIAAGLTLLLALSGRSKSKDRLPRVGTLGLPNLLCFLIAMISGILSGVLRAWFAIKSFAAFELFIGGMIVVAGMLCLFTGRKMTSRGTGRNLPSVLTLVPPVALSFVLIAEYRDLSVLASTSRYIYVLLAIISILLTAFSGAAWAYGRISVPRLFSRLFFALYMLPVVILGDGIYSIRMYSKVGLFTLYSLSEAVSPLLLYLYGFLSALGAVLLFFRPERKTLKDSFEELVR
jgi:hypothetical protein